MGRAMVVCFSSISVEVYGDDLTRKVVWRCFENYGWFLDIEWYIGPNFNEFVIKKLRIKSFIIGTQNPHWKPRLKNFLYVNFKEKYPIDYCQTSLISYAQVVTIRMIRWKALTKMIRKYSSLQQKAESNKVDIWRFKDYLTTKKPFLPRYTCALCRAKRMTAAKRSIHFLKFRWSPNWSSMRKL